MTASPINPELLDHVIAFAGQIASDKVSRHTDKLIVFCDNFFLQFFQSLGVQILAVNAGAKKKAIQFRLEPRAQPLPEPTVALVKWFERLCDIEPDVKALSYDDDDNAALPDFVLTYVPTLLERALVWAKAQAIADLARKTELASGLYAAAIAKLEL